MKTDRPSRTSEGTTAVRAREMRRPPEERICHDPFAVHFLSPFYRKLRRYPWLGRAYGWMRDRLCPGLRGGILARTRYLDEAVSKALADGIEQLVILGAGYDSRAYRLVRPEHRVTVFEVDHPATQLLKLAKLRELFTELPAHVRYVPVDFCRDHLATCLAGSGYRRDARTLFLWEGVIYYLTAEAVDATLRFVTGNSGTGSTIVFDYFPREVASGASSAKEARRLWRIVKRAGEPFLFGIDDDEIEPFLRERGFSQIEVVQASNCKEAWFRGINDKIPVSDMFRLVQARH